MFIEVFINVYCVFTEFFIVYKDLMVNFVLNMFTEVFIDVYSVFIDIFT